MKKIFDLYNFLNKYGFKKEIVILKEAFENTPEELEALYPELYRFYIKGDKTGKYGGIFAQVKKYIEEGYILIDKVNALNTLDELILEMKKAAKLKKKTESRFKYLNKYDIEQEFKDLAKEKKLSKEDFEFAYKSFISEDEDNHELEQAINEIADLREKHRLLREKINTVENNEELLLRLADPLSYKTLNDASTEINNLMMNVNNIIQGRKTGGLKAKLLNYYDYIYNGKNKLNADYPEERRGLAKETSNVLYNDGDWAIVNSWSKEACQYWERSAVNVEGDKVIFKTCTSRIGGVHGLTNNNLYDHYSQYIMLQILKLENGQPKFYEGPNDMLTLCFKLDNNNFKMIQGTSASVNADDKNMTKRMVKDALPENIYIELEKFLSGEKKYNLFGLKEILNSNISSNIVYKRIYEIVQKLNTKDFLYHARLGHIPKEMFDSFLEKKLMRDIDINTLILYKINIIKEGRMQFDIPKDIFNESLRRIAKKIKAYDFFRYFIFQKIIPRDIFKEFIVEKAKQADLDTLVTFRNYIPEDTLIESITEISKTKNPLDFFFSIEKMSFRPDAINLLLKEKIKNLKSDNFFLLLSKIYNENIFKQDEINFLIEKKAKNISSYDFFMYKNKMPKELFNSMALEKAKSLDPGLFFSISKTFPKNVFDSLVEEKAKKLKPPLFFLHNNKIPKNVFDSLAEEKAKKLERHEIFEYESSIPTDIFQSLFIDEKDT